MSDRTKTGSWLTLWRLAFLLPVLVGLAACDDGKSSVSSTTPQPHLSKELIFYNFAEDMPQSILESFTEEYGVTVTYLSYQSPEEAEKKIRAGLRYDVAILENQLIAPLAKDGLLAGIDYANVPNFKNISANFRDLAFDPGNRHSVPTDYGTTGLLIRTDLIGAGLSRWADLWDPRYAGKIGLRAQPREIIGMTLLSLGFAFNSENPKELDAALERLLALRPSVVMVDIEASEGVPKLLSGKIAVLHGYAEDYHLAIESNPEVVYVLPREGTALWGDSYVIAAGSPRKHTAEVFLNFLLRPEIAARGVNEKRYASANHAAIPFIKTDLRNDPVIYPSNEDLQNGHIILSLTPEGEKRYADLWERFKADNPGKEQ